MQDHENSNFPVVSQGRVGDALIPTVNARELHVFLEVGTAFKDWIARRIEDYGFQENLDFCSFLSESSGGRPSKEYHVTLDMAKELSMVDRGEKGKQVRKYFLECERRAKDPSAILNDPAAMRGLLLTYTEKVLELQGQVAELAPKADALDRIATADGSLCVTDAAKNLQVRRNNLFDFLRTNGWIYRRAGTDHDVAYQTKIASGLLEHKTTTVYRSDGTEKITTQVRVTPKGLAFLAKVLPPVATVA